MNDFAQVPTNLIMELNKEANHSSEPTINLKAAQDPQSLDGMVEAKIASLKDEIQAKNKRNSDLVSYNESL
eukprot:CAMPEP_0114589968 /NCGR_PEP_ID=MMETSP0125-20121206/12305_1 /TAXON_ID=485358 ORGANISM="Aristerostoma sp., Strain ATCC 50986" /NCGR_SAMPLE_ID=MMETSP0125 /ASSEMBLY_ACC=CAM_ASM_000245 /LENGTH=70 /DNA_ID=CAMNT_0001787163 /DNA_START=11 /DNA_END=223 /DNA_ORIENTATION=-